MKKLATLRKPLSLSTQTVRVLNGSALSLAVGGVPSDDNTGDPVSTVPACILIVTGHPTVRTTR